VLDTSYIRTLQKVVVPNQSQQACYTLTCINTVGCSDRSGAIYKPSSIAKDNLETFVEKAQK
jgi:hypothetical protein